jgi:hypothetical protein
MKLSILALTLSLLSGSAAAQVALISPISPRINPLAGLPSILPSPSIGSISRPNIGLPAPTLTPTLILSAPAAAAAPLAPSAAVAAGALIATVPNPVQKIPANPVDGRRENVRHPLSAVLPNWTARFAGRDAANDRRPAADARREKDELDDLFDRGSVIPVARREAVGDSRRIGLPEDDFQEIERAQ